MIRIEQIISEFKAYHPEADVSPLQKAYILAARLLASPSGLVAQPIAEHLEVAQILVQLRLDIESIVAGLLYSTIKEHRTSAAELSGHIGEATAKIIEALDQLPGWTGEKASKEEMALSMRQLVEAASQDPRVIFVKLAVRLVRLRHWTSILRHKSASFGSETLEIFSPLAERLGLNHIKVELEDRSFALIHPKEYQHIQKFLKGHQEEHNRFMQAAHDQLAQLLDEQGLKVQVFHRIKHSYSIYLKALKYGVHYSDIHDLLGLRILTETKEDAYKVLGVVHGRFNPVHGRFKDYIAFPKANGYQSLHTMVVNDQGVGFEVQIRTEEMHRVAEMGVAAHWSYKASLPSKAEKSSASLHWLNDLSQSLGIAADPKESLEIFTRELYSDLVYAYTPKGKIIKLPAGSIVLDFAYAIHTDVGNHCTGAKIDGRLVPVHHRLHHGDQVNITTDPEAQPNQTWLGHAQTTRAISQIRQALRKREHKEALKLGREVFCEQIGRFDLSKEEFLKSQEFQGFLNSQGFENPEAFWTQLGFGNASMNELKVYLLSIHEELPSRQRRLVLPFQRRADVVEIPGIEDIQVRLAKCCAPIHGDAIAGLMIQGEGVSVHQTDCKNLNGIDPKRLVEAQWVQTPEERKTVKLLLHFDADIKTHVQIMRIFASAKTTLIECHHRLVENRSTQEITCQVASLDQLAKILKRLNNLNPVTARRVFASPEEEAAG